MGGIPFLPKLKRCCFCTRKLKVACLFIVIWSMLAAIHSTRILFWPACDNLYEIDGGTHYEAISYFKWLLFIINMCTLISSFAYFLGLFWGNKHTADVFMLFGFLSALAMVVHASLNILQIICSYGDTDENDEHSCTDPSDIIAHLIYFFLWCYFIMIVNSHRDNM
ncbi:uncharacterized protein LOC113496479 [Trichoplusia ni]|uniref:Uncharacterized protein LOC113496479 n=1 Tax=Trichoplusia ni TaxID=7111 RepID=A0A7E5VT54_TRINI|nr:uncharacterized protein LOC113496479 [Trichoplusia ni]